MSASATFGFYTSDMYLQDLQSAIEAIWLPYGDDVSCAANQLERLVVIASFVGYPGNEWYEKEQALLSKILLSCFEFTSETFYYYRNLVDACYPDNTLAFQLNSLSQFWQLCWPDMSGASLRFELKRDEFSFDI
jgi:hypothetical protein